MIVRVLWLPLLTLQNYCWLLPRVAAHAPAIQDSSRLSSGDQWSLVGRWRPALAPTDWRELQHPKALQSRWVYKKSDLLWMTIDRTGRHCFLALSAWSSFFWCLFRKHLGWWWDRKSTSAWPRGRALIKGRKRSRWHPTAQSKSSPQSLGWNEAFCAHHRYLFFMP